MSNARATEPTPSHRGWLLLAACLVAAIAFVPFIPAINGGFSDYDDNGFVLQVNGWRGFGLANLEWMFTTFRLGHYQPLTYFTYALDHARADLDPAAYHTTNIVLHAASAVLLMFVIRRVLAVHAARTPDRPMSDRAALLIAAATATLWAVHPLRTESVAWITERRDVLSCVFLLAATLAYMKHASRADLKPARGRWYVLALTFLALSLLAKAWGITFFVVALLLDVRPLHRLPAAPLTWLRDRAARAVLLEKVPFALLGFVGAMLAVRAQSETAARSLVAWGPLDRLLQSAYGVVFYVDRTLVPRNLAVLYELPPSINPAEPRWIISALLALIAGIALIALFHRRTGLVVAFACYLVIISPVLGLFQSGVQLVADRYAHIATIPLFVLVAVGAASLVWRARSSLAPTALLALAAITATSLGFLTWKQSTLWQSDDKLWNSAIARGVDGPILRNYYATHLEGQNRLADAEAQYRESLRLNPKQIDSAFGIGSVLNKQGRFVEAAEAFTHAATIAANPAPALQMLGIVSISKLSKPREAIAAFRAAVDVTDARGNPENTGRPYLLLAAALGQAGDEAAAVPLLKKAAQYEDARAEAEEHLRNLGLLK